MNWRCAASLCHSHSNSRSKMHLQSTSQLAAMRGSQPTEPPWEIRLVYFKNLSRSSCCGAAEMNLTRNHEYVGSIPCLTHGALWCRSQTLLGSGVAVAMTVASSCSSDWTPSLGISMCLEWGPKEKKKKTNKLFDL